MAIVANDSLKGQQSRIMNALRASQGDPMSNQLEAMVSHLGGREDYFTASRNLQNNAIKADVDIYNMMKEQVSQGDAEAAGVHKAIIDVVGDDPKLYTEILQDLQNDPENVNSRNASLKVMKYAADRGIVPLTLQEQRAKILKTQRENSGEDVGATGNIIKKIAAERNIPFSQAAYLYQTGFRQGSNYTPDGKVAPIEGAVDTKGQFKYSEGYNNKMGGLDAESDANLLDMEAMLPELELTVDDLRELGKKATYTKAGRVYDYLNRELDGEPREAALAREAYINTVQNQIFPLLRQTFGAQFTAAEGEKLLTTLGDPNKSPQEKEAALDSFITQKKRAIRSSKRRAAGRTDNKDTAPKNEDAIDYMEFFK